MTTSTLQRILNEWNCHIFAALAAKYGKQATVPADGGQGLAIYDLVDGACHCGKSTGIDQFPEQLIETTSGKSVAVGAVLDSVTANFEADLPVVVAVGINYGQFGSSMPHFGVVPPNWSSTGMRPRLNAVIKQLDESCLDGEFSKLHSCKNGSTPQCHLVAVNFFPLLTQTEWTEIGMNSITEALMLRCWGYADPCAQVAGLIRRIDGEQTGDNGGVGRIPFVVFHGANSAVPLLGIQTAQQLQGSVRSDFVFCDNLSRGGKPTNAIVLLPRHGFRRKDSKLVMDE
jgi:hypothetical protein